jgi:hypothetical protein
VALPPATLPPLDFSDAFLAEAAVAFVPYANDIPIMTGLGVRLANIHEIWVHGGFMPTGDDVGLGFGVLGYRAVLRPERFARPLLGAFVAGLPETCTHDASGEPTCSSSRLFIASATGGLRLEPTPWLGVSIALAAGVDTYPNPFGMIELGLTFALPLARGP